MQYIMSLDSSAFIVPPVDKNHFHERCPTIIYTPDQLIVFTSTQRAYRGFKLPFSVTAKAIHTLISVPQNSEYPISKTVSNAEPP